MTPVYKDKNKSLDERIEDLLGRMTLEEKVRQMDQYSGVAFVDKTHPAMKNCADFNAGIRWDKVQETLGDLGAGCIHDLYGSPDINNALQQYAIENTRLGIPILFSEEALHGLGRPGCSVFPQQIALAATWNPETVEAVGRAIAAETRALGIHEVFAPVIDLARDARWGRIEETYGEDTYLSSRMAAAMVKGLQGKNLSDHNSVVAEVKHFSAYAISEGGLNCGPVRLGPHEHESFYLPVFEAAIKEGGALNVMCSYSAIDGKPCVSDHHLLTGVLRDRWHMKGFVRADMCAIARLHDAHFTAPSPEEAIRQAVAAGVDMQFYDFDHELFQNALIDMVRDGRLKEEVIDRAVSRILRVKFLLGLFDQPYTDGQRYKNVLRCERHGTLALTAARQSICLLRNENGLLPLSKNLKTIAVIGPNTDEAMLGDYTPFIEGFKPITLLEGIKQMVSPETVILCAKGCDVLSEDRSHFEEAVSSARKADVAILALGDSTETCGENFDRCDLNLPGIQAELLRAIYATGTPVVLVLQTGRPLSLSWESAHIPAILEAWFPGEMGGRAMAEVLFGDYNPAGRLPVSFPKSVGQLPVYYSRRPGGGVKYVEGDWLPLFPFGFGLSYTEFTYSELNIEPAAIDTDGSVTVAFRVQNTGNRFGEEVVQLYLHQRCSSMVRPSKELKAFRRIGLMPGETKDLTFSLGYKELRVLDRNLKPIVEPGIYDVLIGSHSSDARLEGTFEVLA